MSFLTNITIDYKAKNFKFEIKLRIILFSDFRTREVRKDEQDKKKKIFFHLRVKIVTISFTNYSNFNKYNQ